MTKRVKSKSKSRCLRCSICRDVLSKKDHIERLGVNIHAWCDIYLSPSHSFDDALEKVRQDTIHKFTAFIAETTIKLTRTTDLPHLGDAEYDDRDDEDRVDVHEEFIQLFLPIPDSVCEHFEWVYRYMSKYKQHVPGYMDCVGISTTIEIIDIQVHDIRVYD